MFVECITGFSPRELHVCGSWTMRCDERLKNDEPTDGSVSSLVILEYRDPRTIKRGSMGLCLKSCSDYL